MQDWCRIECVNIYCRVVHRWELSVPHYHKIMAIYTYPFFIVITQFSPGYSQLYMYINWSLWIIFIHDCICYKINWG